MVIMWPVYSSVICCNKKFIHQFEYVFKVLHQTMQINIWV